MSSEPTSTGGYSNLNDDLVQVMKKQGLEQIATEVGLLHDGKLKELKKNRYLNILEDSATQSPTNASSVHRRKNAKTKSNRKNNHYSPPTPSSESLAKKANPVLESFPFGSSTSTAAAAAIAAAQPTTTERGSKGLRHFSLKVCQKVEEKQLTTYNEVADELVSDYVGQKAYDEKNIRRRVYDALNVLMAMDVISKEKKDIRWRGLPSNAKHQLDMLTLEKNQRSTNIEEKKQQLHELLLQQVAFKNLIARNTATLSANPGSDDEVMADARISLPFIIISTKKDTVIQCEMSEDRQDIFFNLSGPFEIHDDNEVLRLLGMQSTSKGQLPKLIPEQLIKYLPIEYLKTVSEEK